MRIFKVIRQRLGLTKYAMGVKMGMDPSQYIHLEDKQINTSHENINKLKLISGMGPEFWSLFEKEVGK